MNRTHIGFVLYSSGSMAQLKEPVIAGFNQQVAALAKSGQVKVEQAEETAVKAVKKSIRRKFKQ